MSTPELMTMISVQLPAELAEQMRKAAVESDRTLSAEVRRAMKLYLATPMHDRAA